MTPRELVKVKDLEWEGNPVAGGDTAEGLHAFYVAGQYHYEIWQEGRKTGGRTASWDESQAACQAHYENSIYEQLEVR
jgi:hypothetical protein